jgi:diacylglycerol kinase family enzyme
MPVPVILNGTAGGGAGAQQAQALQERFAAAGMEAAVETVAGGRDILDAVDRAMAQGARLIVAAGGDGTQSAVASRLAGTRIVQGVLPLGTLNHFAKDLGIPLELEASVGVVAHGRELAIDVGEVNGRAFINNSSIGLYPDIVLDRERQRRRLGLGKWRAFLSACLHAAQDVPALDVRVEAGGRALRREVPFVFVGNNSYEMEGFAIGRRTSLSDGELSLYMTQRTGRFALLRLALRALFHRLDQARDFDGVTAPAFVVHTRHAQLRVATDGEVTLMRTPLEYRIRPASLTVRVPPDRMSGSGEPRG